MSEPRTPRIAVDAIIERQGKILLIKRKNPPFQGFWALPGGFVEYGENLESALRRETLEETGMSIENIKLHNLYSEPGRDPRGHVISACYTAQSRGRPKAGSDAESAEFISKVDIERLNLAFDHKNIIKEYLEK